jgi:hypothetical protein
MTESLEQMLNMLTTVEGKKSLIKKAVETGMEGYEPYWVQAKQYFAEDAVNSLRENYPTKFFARIFTNRIQTTETKLNALLHRIERRVEEGAGKDAIESLYLDYFNTMLEGRLLTRAEPYDSYKSIEQNKGAASRWITLTMLGNLHTPEAQILQKTVEAMGKLLNDSISRYYLETGFSKPFVSYTTAENLVGLANKAEELGLQKIKTHLLQKAVLSNCHITHLGIIEAFPDSGLVMNDEIYAKCEQAFTKKYGGCYFFDEDRAVVTKFLNSLPEQYQEKMAEVIVSNASPPTDILGSVVNAIGVRAQQLPSYLKLLKRAETNHNYPYALCIATITGDERAKTYAAFVTPKVDPEDTAQLIEKTNEDPYQGNRALLEKTVGQE